MNQSPCCLIKATEPTKGLQINWRKWICEGWNRRFLHPKKWVPDSTKLADSVYLCNPIDLGFNCCESARSQHQIKYPVDRLHEMGSISIELQKNQFSCQDRPKYFCMLPQKTISNEQVQILKVSSTEVGINHFIDITSRLQLSKSLANRAASVEPIQTNRSNWSQQTNHILSLY